MTDKYTAPNQELFDYIKEQTGCVMVQSELNDIINIVLKIIALSEDRHEDCMTQAEHESLHEGN